MANPYGGYQAGGQQYQNPNTYNDPNQQYNNASPYQQGGPAAAGYGTQNPQQFAGQDQSGMNGLNSQMANMGVGAPSSRRKKERHAYHDLNQPAPVTAGPPMGSPAQGFQPAGQFLQQGQPLQPAISPGVQSTPQMNAGDRLRMGEEAVTTQGKVDPEAIPSVARARDLATQQYQTQIYPTMEEDASP